MSSRSSIRLRLELLPRVGAKKGLERSSPDPASCCRAACRSAIRARAPKCGLGLVSVLSNVDRRSTFLRPNPANARESGVWPFIRYAAVCNAVAAADRRAAWARAVASFVAQSGRILSVVITSGALAEREVPRLRPGPGDKLPDEIEVWEDIADMTWYGCDPVPYVSPRRNGGGVYVIPKSGVLQYGHVAISDTNNSSAWASRSASETGGPLGSGCSCSGGCGSGLFIWTKHSEQIGCSQHRVVLRYGG